MIVIAKPHPLFPRIDLLLDGCGRGADWPTGVAAEDASPRASKD